MNCTYNSRLVSPQKKLFRLNRMSENNIPDEEVAEAEVPEVPDEAPVPEEPAEPAAPAPKARGSPDGAKNKPGVGAARVEEEVPEPEAIPKPPKTKRQARPKAAPKAAPRVEAPPPTPQEVAAYMLAALRQQQQYRTDRRRDKYAGRFS